MTGRRPRALAAPAVVLALVLAGCGGGGTNASNQQGQNDQSNGGPAQSAIAAAATKTSNAGSARVSFTATVNAPGQKVVSFDGNGSLDYRTKRGKLTYDISKLIGTTGLSGGNGRAEVIIEDQIIYMKFPLLTQQIPGGKDWIKLDLQKLSKAQGFNLGSLAQLSQSDPTQALQYLRAASSDVQTVGKEQVRGVETTHYKLTVDL